MIVLHCDHCGGVAARAVTGQFLDGDVGGCLTCGIPGSIDVGGFIEQEGEFEIVQVTFFARLEEGDYCNRTDCADCAAARKEAANG